MTIPSDVDQLSPIEDYSMGRSPGRTYRYLDDNQSPDLFPFGYGLSYSTLKYRSSLILSPQLITHLDQRIELNVILFNRGPYEAFFSFTSTMNI